MKLVFLFGNCAVGKMTVGQELTKITPLRLFHNHMMIEPVLEVFGSFRSDVIARLRHVVFEEFAKSDQYGLIFTFMWAFDMQQDWDYIAGIRQLFALPDEDVYYIELVAPQEVRLQRNASENRLKHKASKRISTLPTHDSLGMICDIGAKVSPVRSPIPTISVWITPTSVRKPLHKSSKHTFLSP